MNRKNQLMASGMLAAGLVGLMLSAACGDDPTPPPPPPASEDAGPPDAGPTDAGPPAAVLKRPSKSSTVAISDDDKRVLMVNPEDDSVSLFDTTTKLRVARIALTAGDEPSAVVISPDNSTAFVSNRGSSTVSRIRGIEGTTPTVDGRVSVGSEPTGLALSPTGKRLYVSEFAEGSVALVDTSALTVTTVVKGQLKHPHAVAVTNDGDDVDDDELLIVPEFYGEANANVADFALLDQSRQGRVRVYETVSHTPTSPVVFTPFDSGIQPTGTTGGNAFTSPNQLFSVAVRRDATKNSGKSKIYVTSISASPQAPARFDGNIHPVVYVGELESRTEKRTGAGTVNLSKKILDATANPTSAGKWFLADVVDLAFVTPEAGIGYAISRGADVVQRVVFDDTLGTVTVGSPVNLQINIAGVPAVNDGCKGPTGIVIDSGGAKAYVNCWASKRLGIVALGGTQALETAVESYPALVGKTAEDKGRRFFFTGRGRWSGNATGDSPATDATTNDAAWSSCASCHPAGLSDGITWIFAAGPRQSTSLDGSFSHGIGTQRQRIFNWTGIIDEVHDFERNTRGTSGGKGAITTGTCGTLGSETRKALAASNLGKPVKEDQDGDTGGTTCTKDWDDIEAYMKTIRPPRGLTRLVALDVTAGLAVFGPGTGTGQANCVACHAGPGWTLSRRFFAPSSAGNTTLASQAFAKASAWPTSWNDHTLQIEVEKTGVAPPQVACVIRNLNTFGTTTLAALEKKPDGTSAAQGARGYNIPSLYGVQLGEPYLHHGQAATLEVLLDPAGPWSDHLRAGNPNFDPQPARITELVAFLRSIDAKTTELAVPAGQDGCP